MVCHADLVITPSKYFQRVVSHWLTTRTHADATPINAEEKPKVVAIYNATLTGPQVAAISSAAAALTG